MLPISSKSKKTKKSKKEIQKVELQEIPKEKELSLNEIPSDTEVMDNSERVIERDQSEVLQEIAPKPFQSSILPSKPTASFTKNSISDAFSELKQSILEDEGDKPRPTLVPIPTKPPETVETSSKQKRLEKDMTEVLSFLSKKISVKKLAPHPPEPSPKIEPERKIPPSSMNEILNELTALDSRIEASAIIKTDGTMLASAISSRISDSLFNTIGMNLSMIGEDIIHGLSAGTLKSISVKGSEGVLDLAPIDTESPTLKDMILILFSHPNVKSGIISIAINVIKKQIKYYMGLEQ